jgi:3-oxoacyl-[acyl-carrier protein] reductase
MPGAHGRVALVTGSSRGLGAAIARRLAQDGFAVAVNGQRSDGQAHEVARTIRDDGGTAEAFGADITASRPASSMLTWPRCPPGGWELPATSPAP